MFRAQGTVLLFGRLGLRVLAFRGWGCEVLEAHKYLEMFGADWRFLSSRLTSKSGLKGELSRIRTRVDTKNPA